MYLALLIHNELYGNYVWPISQNFRTASRTTQPSRPYQLTAVIPRSSRSLHNNLIDRTRRQTSRSRNLRRSHGVFRR